MKSIFKLLFSILLLFSIFFMTNNANGYLAPLKQYESGILAKNIICNENLVLIFKSSDRSPRCVKEDTAMALKNRGYTTEFDSSYQMTSIPKILQQSTASIEKCTNEDFPIDWSDCDLYGRVLTNVDLRYANLKGANLFGVTLNDKNLTGANLSYSLLKNGILDGSDLTNVDFSFANLVDTKVRNAVLTNATLKNAILWRTDFTGSNLTNADMSYSTLTRAILSFVDLKNANVEGAGTWKTNLNHCFNHIICE